MAWAIVAPDKGGNDGTSPGLVAGAAVAVAVGVGDVGGNRSAQRCHGSDADRRRRVGAGGDTDDPGDAVMIVTDRGEFCYVVAVKGVAIAALARNHRGAAGGDGPGQILRAFDDQSSTEPDVWPTAVVGISVWDRAPPRSRRRIRIETTWRTNMKAKKENT